MDNFKQVGALYIPTDSVEEVTIEQTEVQKPATMTCCPRCHNYPDCLRLFKKSKMNPRFDHRAKSGKGASMNERELSSVDLSLCREDEDIEHKQQEVTAPEWLNGEENGNNCKGSETGTQGPENGGTKLQ